MTFVFLYRNLHLDGVSCHNVFWHAAVFFKCFFGNDLAGICAAYCCLSKEEVKTTHIWACLGNCLILDSSTAVNSLWFFFFCWWSLLSFFLSAMCSLPYVIQAHKTVKYPTSRIGKHLQCSLKCRIYHNLSAFIGFSRKYGFFLVLSLLSSEPLPLQVSWLLLYSGKKYGWSLMICYCSLSIKPFCCYMCDR